MALRLADKFDGKEVVEQAGTVSLTDLPAATQQKIQDYYIKKMKKHPNMSRDRIMKMVGKKFNMEFSFIDE